jgi:hypothetical protein
MAEYKKQHYIPQFYLRNFSTDRRRVCLFLLAQKKAVRDVNIKGQCVRDYFYSKDIEVEKALSGLIEGPSHIAIERVLKTGHLPAARSDDMAKLLSFVLTLQGRTLAASNAMEEVTEHFGEHVIKSYTQASGKYTADQLKGIRMRLTQPALMSLVIATQMLPLVMDLKPALLTTNQRGLITSDKFETCRPCIPIAIFAELRVIDPEYAVLVSKVLEEKFANVVMVSRDIIWHSQT